MTREELVKSPAYWTAELQNELYRQIEDFMRVHHMNKSQLAEYLGCSKGYVTQLLNGDFDHKMSKFFELALAINKVPVFSFSDADEYIQSEQNNYSTMIMLTPDYIVPDYTSTNNDLNQVA